MAKIIERGLGSEDDPIYFNGYIIGPILRVFMTTAYEAIGIPLYANPGYVVMKRFRSNTAISIVNQGVEQQPTATFEVESRLSIRGMQQLWIGLPCLKQLCLTHSR